MPAGAVADRNSAAVTAAHQDGIRAAEAGRDRMRPLVTPLHIQFDSVENPKAFAAQATTETA
jgi:hypothetical protein